MGTVLGTAEPAGKECGKTASFEADFAASTGGGTLV
jgi:hypothetical protein